MPANDTLVFHVPHADVQSVLSALFVAGAGRIGDDDMCAFLSNGIGHFRPLAGAIPAIGQVGAMERVGRTRCEVPSDPSSREQVLSAPSRAHPYEEPVYCVISGGL